MRRSHWRQHPVFGDEQPTDDSTLLFHYTTLTNAAAIALTESLLLSPLSALNDPQESTMRSVVTVTGASGQVSPRQVPRDERRGYELALTDLRSGVRLACFTRDAAMGKPGTAARADGRGYARPRVWTQYGDKHRGVCLLLDRLRLEARAADQFGAQCWSRGVHYVAGFDDTLASAETADFDAPDPRRHFDQKVLRSLLNKNADWEGEREHRIATWDRPEPACALPVQDVVVGLVLGLAFQPHLMMVAQRIAEVFDVVGSTAVLTLNNSVLDPMPPIGPDGAWHRWTDDDLRQPGRVFDL